MSEVRAVIFDADGVSIHPSENFSVQYAKSRGMNPSTLQPFFGEEFNQAMIGQADLRELLEKYKDLWEFEGTVDDLLHEWFETLNLPNNEVVELIKNLKNQGVKCYLATNQEKYRTQYFRDVMFPGLFDQIFSSSEIGAKKSNPEYFRHVLGELALEGFKPKEVAYFDDEQPNVDVARNLGISAFIYESPTQILKLVKVI